jgi:rod shape-determining protein MreC
LALQSRTRSIRGLVILLVAASLATITIDYREPDGPLSRVGDAALTIIIPMQEGVSAALRPVTRFFSALARLPSLEEENRRLKDELAEAQTSLIGVDALRKELEDLEEAIGVKQIYPETVAVTEVNSYSVSNFEWSVGISAGSGEGVREGMAVVNSSGLVGIVVRVTTLGSKVLLLLDTQFQVAGRLIDSQHTGMVTGTGPADPTMTFTGVTVDEVAVGEPVETSGYQMGDERSPFPPGVPIGEVTEVSAVPGLEEAQVRLRPWVDFSALDKVVVVQPTEVG